VDDPLEMYLSDLFTTFVNLSRIPSISVPCGHTHGKGVEAGITKGFDGEFAKAARTGKSDSMPVGIQFAGPMFSEKKILRIAQAWEADHIGCGCPVAE
jgi:aspartyl-tRNA(Asn)/glutamyl-tRNA(Gln) amidotransferase subunit A